MIEELTAALNDYQVKWAAMSAERKDRSFFDNLKPTAVGWKTADPGDFDKRYAMLRAYSDQIHMGWVNERWLATFHLREPIAWGISLVKLMQLRPGSQDKIGLDHVDFLAPDGATAAIVKSIETDLNVTDEQNGPHCRWVSVWFAGTEAKLRSDTVLDVCIAELEAVKNPQGQEPAAT
ncbi:MAG TPA: hypothetical protein VF466_05255 [Candidatus Saccharimonadales bacterium]